MGFDLVPAGTADPVLLQVTGGAHRGVVVPLGSGPCRVGASTGSDIVLSDRDVVDDHATLRLDRGRLMIEARGGDVSLADGQVVPKGQGCRVRLPADIRIGSSAIRLTGPAGRPSWMQPPVAAVICVALLLVGSIVATQAGFTASDVTGAQTAATEPAAIVPRQPADPAAALREKVAAAGIEGLKIDSEGDRIVARGAIDDAARPAWASTQRWFDETFGGRYVLASEVGAKSALARPRFQLQAVWFGPSPYVVTADGQRRYAGATLGDGWVLKDIRENKIIVAKADQEMTLSY